MPERRLQRTRDAYRDSLTTVATQPFAAPHWQRGYGIRVQYAGYGMSVHDTLEEAEADLRAPRVMDGISRAPWRAMHDNAAEQIARKET